MTQNYASINSEGYPEQGRTIGIPNTEVWVWVFITAALLVMRVYPSFEVPTLPRLFLPALCNDSFQYISIAENALKGHFGYTSLIHFDAERSFGEIPAPMVTFPAGYPLAIALVSLTGISTQTAGLLVSAAATVACVPVLAWIAGQLGLSRAFRSVVLGCFVFNGAVIEFGSSVLSEALFSCVVLLGISLLLGAQLHSGLRLWAGAGLAFGGAYFVRYAGLFFVVGLALIVGRHLLAPNRSLAKGYAVAFAVASCAVIIGIMRNVILVGNWRGGNEKIVSNPVSSVLLKTIRDPFGLMLGPGTWDGGWVALFGSREATFIPSALFLNLLFLALLLAGIVCLTWGALRWRELRSYRPSALAGKWIDLLLLASAYVACMFYVGMTSVISYGPRMFVPLIPLLALGVGLTLQAILKTRARLSTPNKLGLIALAVSFCLYAFLNLIVNRRPQVDLASVVAMQMDSAASDGTSARAAVRSHVGQQSVVVANNGQAVGYVLALPTVSLIEPHYSSVEWSEAAIREVLYRFKAAAIVITAHIPGQPDNEDLLPSPFIRQLAKGESPLWLRLVHRSDDLMVYVPQLELQ